MYSIVARCIWYIYSKSKNHYFIIDIILFLCLGHPRLEKQPIKYHKRKKNYFTCTKITVRLYKLYNMLCNAFTSFPNYIIYIYISAAIPAAVAAAAVIKSLLHLYNIFNNIVLCI